jgi:porin
LDITPRRSAQISRRVSASALPAIIITVCAGVAPAHATTDPDSTVDDSAATQQGQDSEAPPSTLTGEWGGLRTALRNEGVDFGGYYKAEPATNIEGDSRTITNPAEFSLRATLNADKLFGLTGGTIQASLAYRQGTELSLGLLQQAQEAYGRGKVVRLAELWYQQPLDDDAVTLKFGRMPEGDFGSFPCYFNSNTFCGAPAGSLVSNYWYDWPVSGWAAWGRFDMGKFDLMVGAHETNPQDLGESSAPAWFHGATGVMGHAEGGWTPELGTNQLQGRYQAGVWCDTSGGNDVLLGANGLPYALTGLPPLRRSDRYGYYVQALQQLTGIGAVDSSRTWHGIRGLTLFANVVEADRATAVKDSKVSVGLLYAAPFLTRPNDHVGFAIGRTGYNSRAAESIALESPGTTTPRAEYASELYYSYLALPWLALRPDLQYIVDPGGYIHAKSDIVVGARIVVTF